MAEQGKKHVSNPLTLIAIFAGLSETVSTAVLPLLDKSLQGQFMYFIMGFPTLLVLIFFGILILNRKILYAPGDFNDETNFMTLQGTSAYTATGQLQNSAIITKFIEPEGVPNHENKVKLIHWMKQNGLSEVLVPIFLVSNEYSDQRQKAVTDLGLG